ncbi:hypothetical protein HW555_005353 [Spodoptera exigua]|uniref:Uncharacterized protein n=1 Tax=Spodoptera exigua TaxID=7107 RepID=A0A835GK12_SPOEX|nr:hypothetical protein HW555_005353 [Spodoptera exigua]
MSIFNLCLKRPYYLSQMVSKICNTKFTLWSYVPIYVCSFQAAPIEKAFDDIIIIFCKAFATYTHNLETTIISKKLISTTQRILGNKCKLSTITRHNVLVVSTRLPLVTSWHLKIDIVMLLISIYAAK